MIFEALARSETITPTQIKKVLVDLSLSTRKRIADLASSDVNANPGAKILLGKCGLNLEELKESTVEGLKAKIQAGVSTKKNTIFWHTEPHHDDLMLGYLPYIARYIREHSHHHFFTTLTSGFTAVTNAFMLKQLKTLQQWMDQPGFIALFDEGYFNPASRTLRNRDIWQYLDGVAANSHTPT